MKRKNLIPLFTAFMIVTACLPSPDSDADEPVSSDDLPVPTMTVDHQKYELGERAIIESVDIMFLESFPLQVRILVTGSLPDGCTTVYRAESAREDNKFTVQIFTLRERDAMCTQALVPFEISVPLDVYGLPAGTYKVIVYDFVTEFTFTQDNIIQES
jgi:inhibitor of cysteine peptidase